MITGAMALVTALLLALGGPAQAAVQGMLQERTGGVVSPDIRLLDEAGRELTVGSLLGRPLVVSLVYHGCGSICPRLLGDLADAAGRMDLRPVRDYRIATVSFDERDTRETADRLRRNFLPAAGAGFPDEGWRFLTGARGNILRLTDAVGFKFRREGQGFIHPRTVIVLSAEGRIVRYLPAGRVLPGDLQMAIQEASGGWLQAFCFTYDAAEGRYLFNTGRVLLMVSALAAALAVSWMWYAGTKAEGRHAA